MALEIFRLVGSVFVDTDKADQSLKKTDDNAGKLGQSLADGARKVGQFAAGVATTAAAAGAGIVALTENTRDYRTEQGKLTTAFETQNFTADQARTTYEALNGVLGDSGQAVEASNHLAMLCDNEEELATWTDICTGVYATFGDSLPIEGLTEAANETAKTGSLTGGLADALNWAGVNEDKFQESLDACANEQERQALITETLNGLYAESAEHYRETNAEVIAANEAQDKLNNAMANIGETLEPIVTKGKELVAEVLTKAAPTLQDIAEFVIPLLSDAISTLVDWLGKAVGWFQDMYTWCTENDTAFGLIAITLGTLTAAIIAWNIAQNAATIATTLATAATTAWGTVMAFVTSPVTLVVAAIGALIAIVYLLITHWDEVKEAAIKCWEWIKETWNKVAEWFNTNVIQPVANFFSNLGENIREAFQKAWEGVKNSWQKAGDFFKKIWQNCKDAFGNVAEWFRVKFSKAWAAVKMVFSAGGKVFEGIKEGIANVFRTVVNAIIRGINKVIAVPFNKINRILDKLRSLTILKLKPFTWIGSLSVPQIPELEEGGVLKRGQVGLLEGNGAEAVVPLERNKQWISAVARDMDTIMGGQTGAQVVAVLMDILEAIEDLTGMGIFLDKDKLVGELAKPMDRKLGQLQAKKARA